jgi:hypothetical protein
MTATEERYARLLYEQYLAYVMDTEVEDTEELSVLEELLDPRSKKICAAQCFHWIEKAI